MKTSNYVLDYHADATGWRLWKLGRLRITRRVLDAPMAVVTRRARRLTLLTATCLYTLAWD